MRLREFAFTFTALAALAAAPAPQVSFTTNLGSFTVQLNPEAAPATVANFLAYVRSGQYKGTTFHRVIPSFMIQGGGMTVDGVEKPTRPPIPNEAKQALAKGLKNIRGSIAMARTSDPNSATAQFFVNVVDNPFLDYPSQDGWGYCVFGQVVKGLDTIDKIKQVKTSTGDNPVAPVLITNAVVLGAKQK
jgi:cyclophilin family peptidyl-prolyl cis-trans isomerase